ncbi:MAG: hypothetical protein MCSN_1720 [Candidatus Microsyncoccus archaeolyticus]|nr:MAG: hypothetical protein MCSN_1720 [Candidatus Parcubacteria bacterium]
MKTFLISYDLGAPETTEDYGKVIASIKSLDDWAKPLYSVWLVKSDKTASQIRDQINKETDTNDKLLVIDVSGAGWATSGISNEVTDWMKNNL